ncbi:actin cytoskeleton and mitosis protein [Exophiala xenobiotica]|nr:actin cytoskeleton and mitosis protein [Exophiala xenobiotica]KAK5217791.1 actin cytoskeleton and mitosis protein [Exophiala xenobiotica]KAK5291931.1 actin cytoskeleton and mitosis protein [Exophiala xenobiotica]KAK5494656.1 actin cytoskeleton and mitosis protein [Exophiala xenobiotica]
MSAPSIRGQRGGSSTRGGRATQSIPPRGRGGSRGQPKPASAGRGRGRGGSSVNASATSGDGLLQRLRAGTVKRGSDNGTTTPTRGRGGSSSAPFTPNVGGRGRGRGFLSQTFNTPRSQDSTPSGSRTSSPAPTNHRDFMNTAYARYQELKTKREDERAKAIRDGFLADPEKKTSLDKAITPVGTCTEMCPEFERVERIVQNMVDKAEKIRNDDTGKDIPAEERMVKRFRRSAAGYDEQLPSDIRTPATLRRTLDYLLDKVIGGDERLATIHKFVWDRTRGIRNDFSIQQVTNVEDVKIAVDCYERIARFHILSLHQLSNPDNLWDGENFDAHQEREQLNNTLLSLLYYYDDNRQRIDFPNEAEFRAYCIVFEFQSQHPDLEDRIQAWPSNLLKDMRVQTALKLYQAAGNSLFDQGPLRPMEPFAIAQSNTGAFWHVLSSKAVPYIMACVAEIYFAHVRFAALDALWRSCKSAPAAQQAKSRDWSLSEVTAFLGFDTEEETKEFCAAFELYFAKDEYGEDCLDATANAAHSLDQSQIPNRQSFSHTYVEKKRYRRTLTAVINGATVAEAIRQGWVVESPDEESDSQQNEVREDDQSMFVPQDRPQSASSSIFGSSLNPAASTFTPKFGQSPGTGKATEKSTFGQPTSTSTSASAFGQPSTGFGGSGFGSSGFGSFGSSPVPADSPFGKPASSQQQQPQKETPFSFAGFGVSSGTTKNEVDAAQTQKSALPVAQAPQPTFPGFGFGKPTSKPVETSAPPTAAPTSTTSTIPPVFGQKPVPQTVFAAAAGRPEDSKKTPSAPPFQFPSFSQPSTQPAKPSEQAPQAQVSATPATPSFPASAPTFTFSPQSSQQPTTPAQQTPLPSFTSSSGGFSFVPTSTAAASSPTSAILPPQPPSATEDKPKIPVEEFKFTSFKPSTTPSPSQVTPKPDLFPSKLPSTTPSLSQPPATQPPQQSTSPLHSPPLPPSKPAFTTEDRERLARDVASIALTRQDGLIRRYIEYTLPDLVRTALNQHQLEVHDAAVASIRERILSRKFGLIWRSRAWKNNLNRRARNRRKLIAETMRAEESKKKRSEEELQEILLAAQETKRLQQEVQEAAEAKKLKEEQDQFAISQIVGRKRKSFSGQNMKESVMTRNGTPRLSGHKRSKTMSTSSEPSSSVMGGRPPVPSFRASTTRAPHVSIFSGKPVMGRSTSVQDLRNSTVEQKTDNTHTDYFRLKALGLDPDTPIVPDTKETLALRKRREEDERRSVMARARRRPGMPTSVQSSPTAPSPVPVEQKPIETIAPAKEIPHQTATKGPVEDDFLRQIREAREAMKEQEEWFKQQAGELEKEIEHEEEFRRSQSSRRESFTPSLRDGLARANGYEYLPGETKSEFSMSRTERRIRQTGAHGLATKPLRPSSEYVPVAMSKRSALRYSGGESQTNSPVRKRSHDDVDVDVDPALNLDDERYRVNRTGYAVKRPKSAQPVTAAPPQSSKMIPRTAVHQPNPYELLQGVEQDEEESDVEDEDEEEAIYDEVEPSGQYYSEDYVNGRGGGDEEELEEDEEDESELEREGYEDEDEYDEDGDGDGDGDEEEEEGFEYDDSDADGYGYPDEGETPLTNPEMSRATSSGPGASVDDALVLSDSD